MAVIMVKVVEAITCSGGAEVKALSTVIVATMTVGADKIAHVAKFMDLVFSPFVIS